MNPCRIAPQLGETPWRPEAACRVVGHHQPFRLGFGRTARRLHQSSQSQLNWTARQHLQQGPVSIATRQLASFMHSTSQLQTAGRLATSPTRIASLPRQACLEASPVTSESSRTEAVNIEPWLHHTSSHRLQCRSSRELSRRELRRQSNSPNPLFAL